MINNQDVNADRVYVLSDITSGCHVRYNRFDIMECSDVINSAYGVLHAVGVISYIHSLGYHQSSG